MARNDHSGNNLSKEERQWRFLEGVKLGLSDMEALKFKAQLINPRSLERWRRESPEFKERHEKAKELGRAFREENPVQYHVTLDSCVNTALAFLQDTIHSEVASINEKMIAARIITEYEPKSKTVRLDERVIDHQLGTRKIAEAADEAAQIEVDFD